MQTEQESREEAGLIHDTLAFLANFGCRHPWIVLIGTLLTCVASLATSVCYLKYHTQRNDLISPSKDYLQRWKQYVAEFGDDDDMVVVVEGSDRKQMELALEDLAQQVSREPELYDRLFYKVDLRDLNNRKLLFVPYEQIAQIQAGIDGMWPLLNTPLNAIDRTIPWKLMGVRHIIDDASMRVAKIKELGGSDDSLKQFTLISQRAGEFLREPSSYRSPWIDIMPRDGREDYLEKVKYFFSDDGKLATLLVRPMKEKDGFTFAQKSIDGVRGILKDTQARYPDLQFGLTGLPVLENDEMIASQNDSNNASWLALIGVGVLYLVVYRGFRYPLMTVAALLVGTAWALGWMTLTVGHLNILSSAFAVMLIGMGDYGVLWVTRFGQERQSGASLEEAISITAVSVGPGILTAALTTALAFFATMLADLKAVAELGWIAGCGVLLCALSCFVVMPALLSLFDGRLRKKKTADEPTILSLAEAKEAGRQWLPSLTHRPRWIIPICIAATVLLAWIAKDVSYDHNLLHMQDRNLESVKWQDKLTRANTGASWYAVSYTNNTPEEARKLKARFEKLPEVSKVEGVAELVPEEQERKMEKLRAIQKSLRMLPDRDKLIKHDPVDAQEIVAAAKALCARLAPMEGVELRKLRESLLFLIDSIKTVDAHAAVIPDADGTPGSGQADVLLQKYEDNFTMDLLRNLHMLRDISNPAPIQVADLPVNLRERFLGKNGKWLLQIFARESLWEFENMEKFVAAVQTVDAEATGKPFSALEGLKAMKDGFFWAGIYAFIAMVIVLLLDFGNVKHMALALAPLLMGLVATLGLMVLCGIPLNPANMIAFPLVLGVGADNGVHVLHDYRTRPRDRRYSLSFATGWGIMVAALTTILGFCTLMISQHRGLYSLGLVLTLGVTCCMLTALIFLPALLRSVSTRGAQRHIAKVAERRSA